MASCFSTDNTSSPLGLLAGWKTARSILKFFFHSLSGKIPLNKLSRHYSALLEFLHILPRRRSILVRMCRSRATAALYCCVAWTVSCFWRRLCVIKSDNKKPQCWKVAARAPSERKSALTANMRRLPAILSVYMRCDHATTSRNLTPGL